MEQDEKSNPIFLFRNIQLQINSGDNDKDKSKTPIPNPKQNHFFDLLAPMKNEITDYREKQDLNYKTVLKSNNKNNIIPSLIIQKNEIHGTKEKFNLEMKKEEPEQTVHEYLLEVERQTEVNGWSKQKQKTILRWQKDINYERLVNYFFSYSLKNKESFWSWTLILLTTVVSGLALFTFDEDVKYEISITVKIVMTTSSIFATLIAAWLKKQNYIDRIKTLDRYLTRLITLNKQIENILSLSPLDRIPYSEFKQHYQEPIIKLLSTTPPISPEEYKESVYMLTKYYPELVKNVFPWYDQGVMTAFGSDVLLTYKRIKYSTMMTKLFSCYFCKSKCCRKFPQSIFEKHTPQYQKAAKDMLDLLEAGEM